MKILHTADWHLGKKLEGFSRIEEQRQVLEEICGLAEAHDVDVVLIAGDIYDQFKPAVEAEDLFYRTAYRLAANGRRAVIAIAGNHDSPDRIAAPNALAEECGIILAGYPDHVAGCRKYSGGIEIVRSRKGAAEIRLANGELLRVLLAPYANELRLKTYLGKEHEAEGIRQVLQEVWNETAAEYCDDNGVNILVGHMLMAHEGEPVPEEPEGERSVLQIGGAQAVYTSSLPQRLQYAAFGHLHRYQYIKGRDYPVVYSGSPLSYSMSEAGQQKYALLLEAGAGKAVDITPLPLASGYQLHRKTFTSVDEAEKWLLDNPNSIVELTMQTEHYLTPDERRRLAKAHNRIIGPIPIVKNTGSEAEENRGVDLSQDVSELFRQYFKSSHHTEPGRELMDLFKEILDEEEGEGE